MFLKHNNYTWKYKSNKNILDLSLNIDKIKKYSKGFNSASYSLTNNLNNIYPSINLQHALWFKLTDFTTSNSIELFNNTFEKNKLYNLFNYADIDTINNSTELKNLIQYGYVKCATSKLKLSTDRENWFNDYTPYKINQVFDKQFDYMVITYTSKDNYDIESQTALQKTNYQFYYIKDNITYTSSVTPIDGSYIGFSDGNLIENTSNQYLIQYGNDNIISESVCIFFKNIASTLVDISDIAIELKAKFFNNTEIGDINVDVKTYKNGTMYLSGNTFFNSNGFLASEQNFVYTLPLNSNLSNGINIGTVIYSKLKQSAIFTNTPYNTLAINYNSLLATIDFSAYKWVTNNFDISLYSDMIINETFNTNTLTADFNNVNNTQLNVFNTEKLWDKILNNYTIVDLVSTENVLINDINLTIDSVKLQESNIVLLKNQTNLTENGIYIFTNNTLKQNILKYTDLVNLICYVKNGAVNINKTFYLKQNEQGLYEEDNLVFIEGQNYILRNRNSYKMNNNHNLNACDYVNVKQPLTNFDYTNRLFITTDFYYVDDNKLYYNNNDVIQNTLNTSILSKKIQNFNNEIYLLQNNNKLVKFNTFATDFINISDLTTFNKKYLSFQILSNTNILLLDEDGNIDNINYTTNLLVSSTPLNAIEFINAFNLIFFLTSEGLYYYDNNINFIKNVKAKELRIDTSDIQNIVLSYLINNIPETIRIDKDLLNNKWITERSIEFYDFSKTKTKNWEVKSNELYLKNIQITNKQTYIPKTEDDCFFDGIDDFVFIDNSFIMPNTFTVQFNLTSLKANSAIFYFGDSKVNYFDTTSQTNVVVMPSKYITSYIQDGSVYFSLSINGFDYILNSSVITENCNVSIVFNNTQNSIVCSIYINNTLDISNTVYTTTTINTSFETCYLGASEFNIPYYNGYIKDFRIWNIALNLPQIGLRSDDYIESTDVLYNNLIFNLKLNDFYQDTVFNNITNTEYLFFGKLTSNALTVLQSVNQIISDTDILYVLSNNKSFLFSEELKNIDNTITTISNLLDITDTNTVAFITSPKYYFIKSLSTDFAFDNIENLDEAEIEIECYGRGTIEIKNVNIVVAQIEVDTTEWNTSVLTSTITGNSMMLGFVPSNELYIRSVTYKLTKNRNVSQLYKLEEKTSNLTLMYTDYEITAFDINPNFYFLKDNNIYNINKTIVDTFVPSIVSTAIDFTILNNEYYYLTDNSVYKNNTLLINIPNGFIYSKSNWSDNILYIKTSESLMIYVNDIYYKTLNQYYSLYTTINEITIINTDDFKIENNEIYFNNKILDRNNLYWNYKKKNVLSIIETYDNSAIVMSVDTDNVINLYKFNGLDIVKISNNEISITSPNTPLLRYYNYTKEWIFIINNNKIYFFNLIDNKTYTNLYSYFTINNISDIIFENVNTFFYINNNNLVKMTSLNYDLFSNESEFNNSLIGTVVGDYGVVFDDDLTFELNNIVHKEDINDVCLVRKKISESGYEYLVFNNIKYIVGNNGFCAKTIDGINYNIIETNTFKNLNAVKFNDNYGIIVGDDIILTTINNGLVFNTLKTNIIRKWTDVYLYENKAIIIGNHGTVLMLEIINNKYAITNTITLDYTFKLNKIKYHEGSFYIVGDNSLICKITNSNIYYYRLNINRNFNDIDFFTTANNEKNAYLSSDNKVFILKYDYILPTHNIVDYYTCKSKINTITINDNVLYIFGKNLLNIKHDLLSKTDTALDLSGNFTQKLLFTDYYLARKVNVLLEDNFIIPTGSLPKTELYCYRFDNNEYIEFNYNIDYNNYVSYQDFIFLNKRVLDEPNSDKLLQNPYNKYNKKITAIDDYTNNAVFKGINIEYKNESVTDLSKYEYPTLREDFLTSKFQLGWNNTSDYTISITTNGYVYSTTPEITEFKLDAPLNSNVGDYLKLNTDTLYEITKEYAIANQYFVQIKAFIPVYSGAISLVKFNFNNLVKKNDVLSIVCLNKQRNIPINENDILYLQITADSILLDSTAIAKNTNNIYTLDFNIECIDLFFTVEFNKGDTIDEVLIKLRNNESIPVLVANKLLENRCKFADVYTETIKKIDIFDFSSNATILDMINIGNTIYVLLNNKRLILINANDNRVISNYQLSANNNKLSYNQQYKSIYVTGNSNIIDIFYTETNTILSTSTSFINNKSLFINGSMYVLSSNKIYLFNNLFLAETINLSAFAYDILFYNDKIYVLLNNKLAIFNINNVLISEIPLPNFCSYMFIDNNNIWMVGSTQVVIYNISTMLINTIDTYSDIYENVKFGNDNMLLVANGNTFQVIDKDTQLIEREVYVNIYINDIAYNESEKRIYFSDTQGNIVVIEANTINLLSLNDTPILNVTYSSKLKYVNNLIYLISSNTLNISYLYTDKSEPTNISIELDLLKTNITSVVRDIVGSTISLYDLLDSELIHEMNQCKSVIKNLNYFDGDMLSLKNILSKHLLGHSYSIDLSTDNIVFNGVVNDITKYYNLETSIKFNNNVILCKYENDMYNQNYSLYKLLNNTNPIFTADYSFNLPSNSYTYNNNFFIKYNTIYIHESLSNEFITGTFIDIISMNNTVSSIYITDIHKDGEYNLIVTNYNIESNIDLYGIVNIRTRDKLSEISKDLEYTDNIMFPLTYSKTYFNYDITSKAYHNILISDDNVLRNISSVAYIDNNNDFVLSVIDWKNDINFYYRPLEIFEIGIDKVLKKSITVTPANYLIKGNVLQLKNIDFGKYNYILTDGLTVKSLEDKYYWVLNADIRNAVIGEKDDKLVWYKGDWLEGEFEDGVWYSGYAKNILWNNGIVYSYIVQNNSNIFNESFFDVTQTVFDFCIFKDGEFNGTFNNGIFNKGKFNGTFNDGIFVNGEFNGDFKGGVIKNAIWVKGTFSQENTLAIWENGIWLSGDFENGLWKNGVFGKSSNYSRFGTKSSNISNAIWEYGYFYSGEIHSPISNEFTKIKNIVIEDCVFSGGQIDYCIWRNGTVYNGYFKENLIIDKWNIVNNIINGKKQVHVKFENPHFFKNLMYFDNNVLTELEKSFIMIGEPIITNGILHNNVKLLGHNTSPVRHYIKEIIDDYTVLIEINDSQYPYLLPDNSDGYIDDYEYDTLSVNTVELLPSTGDILFNSRNLIFIKQSNNTIKVYDYKTNTFIQTINVVNFQDFAYHKNTDTMIFVTSTNIIYYNCTLNTIQTSIIVTNSKYVVIDEFHDYIVIISQINNRIYYLNPYTLNFISNIHVLNNYTFDKPFMDSIGICNFTASNLSTTVLYKVQPDVVVIDSVSDYGKKLILVNGNDFYYTFNNTLIKNSIVIYNITSINFGIRYISEINKLVIIDTEIIITNAIPVEMNKLVIDNISIYINESIDGDIIDVVFFDGFYYVLGVSNIFVVLNTSIVHTYAINADTILVFNNKIYFTDTYLKFFSPTCIECSDYTLKSIDNENVRNFDYLTSQYKVNSIVSFWNKGVFNGGIIDNIYWNDGEFNGGIINHAIYDNGTF